ncbi:MAG: transcription elongation factor GreA [Chloroflexi bacterium]|nr:transcription elongation factor GreA [Chloroflexota bacterium]MCL5110245.1 transcription elongation factor GreA [Chloroflexota bacterium]
MQVKPVYLTAEGKTKIEEELHYLRCVRRKEAEERIKIAREAADAVGNPEFDEAKDELGFVDGRIRSLEAMLANAVLIDPNHNDAHGVVHIGSEVVLTNEDGEEETYTIVGKAEANPKLGRISNESPIGRALLDRRAGDEIEIAVPDGNLRLRIVKTT